MSLGFARDSIVDLTRFASEETNECSSSLYVSPETESNLSVSNEDSSDDDYLFFDAAESEDALTHASPLVPSISYQQQLPSVTENFVSPRSSQQPTHSLTTDSTTSVSAKVTANDTTNDCEGEKQDESGNAVSSSSSELLSENTLENSSDKGNIHMKHHSNGWYGSSSGDGYSFDPQSDYYEDFYPSDPYMSYGLDYDDERNKNKSLFCCIFPYLVKDENSDDEYGNDGTETENESDFTEGILKRPGTILQSNGIEVETHLHIQEDPNLLNATESETNGFNHSNITIKDAHDKNSVTLANTASTVNTTGETGSMETSLHAESVVLSETTVGIKKDQVKKLKGILKKTLTKPTMSTAERRGVSRSKDEEGSNGRRTLFPTYGPRAESQITNENSNIHEGNNEKSEKNASRHINFAPMARVTTITARSDLSFMDRSRIWWQRSDYDDFKKAGRIISKAMVEGGSEIWLQTSNAWGKKQQQSFSSQTSNNAEYSRALKKYGVVVNYDTGDETTNENDFGYKWWCKFGHSRRGLEHIVSIEEGRQRQRSVTNAIRSILDEQRRQRLTRTRDLKKLSLVSMQYTTWARDLALAAGRADAEAVRSNFDAKAKSRFHYLHTGLKGNNVGTNGAQNKSNFSSRQCASFIFSANPTAMAEILDANTTSSIMLRQHTKMSQPMKSSPSIDHVNAKPSPATKHVAEIDTNATGFIQNGGPGLSNNLFQEAIHDTNNSHENIAKIAAGFGADGENMSSVMTGMGTVSTSRTRIGAH